MVDFQFILPWYKSNDHTFTYVATDFFTKPHFNINIGNLQNVIGFTLKKKTPQNLGAMNN